ncbi:hypothetical protein [Bacteroides caccae]|uniref:hypothetical protein n=1 Tax=Bacteroides caccae TaxID=47678 RepID=UPI00321B89B1
MKVLKFLFIVSMFIIASCSSDDDNDITEQQQIGDTNGYQYVDLGLSVKWATCNVGATSPYDTGNLYAWGEVSPKEEYLLTNYKHWTDVKNITKYCTDSNFGTVDGLTMLATEDDVVRIEMGGDWRMPTIKEINELCSLCTIKRDTLNSVPGISVTGPNGGSMFVPGRTYWQKSGYSNPIYNTSDDSGGFWSVDLCTRYEQKLLCAYAFHFSTNIKGGGVAYENGSTSMRYLGLACRGVIE